MCLMLFLGGTGEDLLDIWQNGDITKLLIFKYIYIFFSIEMNDMQTIRTTHLIQIKTFDLLGLTGPWIHILIFSM